MIVIIALIVALILVPKPYSFEEGDNCSPWDWHKESGWCVGIIYPLYKDTAINCDPKKFFVFGMNNISDTIEFKKGFYCAGVKLFKSSIAIN